MVIIIQFNHTLNVLRKSCIIENYDVQFIERFKINFYFVPTLLSGAVVPTSNAIGLHFYPIWEATSLDEWVRGVV